MIREGGCSRCKGTENSTHCVNKLKKYEEQIVFSVDDVHVVAACSMFDSAPL